MPSQPVLTERDIELLSAYLDDALDPAEKAELEARLLVERNLRRELEAMRQTVGLLRAMPPLKAPRDFTLPLAIPQATSTLAHLPQPTSRPRYRAAWLGAAAAFFAFLFGGALVLQNSFTQSASTVASRFDDASSAGASQVAAAPTQAATDTPLAITPTPAPTLAMMEANTVPLPTTTAEIFLAMPEVAPPVAQSPSGGGGFGGGGDGPQDDFLDATHQEGLFRPEELEAPSAMMDTALAEEAGASATNAEEALLFSARSATADSDALGALGRALAGVVQWLGALLATDSP